MHNNSPEKITPFAYRPQLNQHGMNASISYEALQDIYIIINTIIKRKLLKTLQTIKLHNFNKSRQESIIEGSQRGLKFDKTIKKTIGYVGKVRAKSLDPYSEYSRAKLLQDIVGKLKAKNQLSKQINFTDSTSIDIRISKLEKIISQHYYQRNYDRSSQQSYQDENKIAQLIKQIGQLRKQQQKCKLDEYIRPIEVISNVSNLTPQSNHSLYSDILPQLEGKKTLGTPINKKSQNCQRDIIEMRNEYKKYNPQMYSTRNNQQFQFKQNKKSELRIKKSSQNLKTKQRQLRYQNNFGSNYYHSSYQILPKMHHEPLHNNKVERVNPLNFNTRQVNFSHHQTQPYEQSTHRQHQQINLLSTPVWTTPTKQKRFEHSQANNFIINNNTSSNKRNIEYFPIQLCTKPQNKNTQVECKKTMEDNANFRQMARMNNFQKQSQESSQRGKSMTGISFGKINVLSPRPYNLKQQPYNSRESVKQSGRKRQTSNYYFKYKN